MPSEYTLGLWIPAWRWVWGTVGAGSTIPADVEDPSIRSKFDPSVGTAPDAEADKATPSAGFIFNKWDDTSAKVVTWHEIYGERGKQFHLDETSVTLFPK
jgi:hypothetical protein